MILHRCGEGFYFLLVSTWRNENELWETVWSRREHQPAFEPWPLETAHHPTSCVWELRAVCHEQGAWSRHLRSRASRERHADLPGGFLRGRRLEKL